MTTPQIPQGRVRLFACGGGGINIGHRFEQHRGKIATGFASIDTVYIDTSRSNLNSDVEAKHVYLLDGLDGSGGLRRENAQVISERARDILKNFEPLDVNIVLSTGAGGSGSVIAPSLVSELLALELPTIVVMVGSIEDRQGAENTLKTLKSYEAVAKLRQVPVVIGYFQNGQRAAVDAGVDSLITALCALYSRQNRELDSQDLYNFLRFDRVTSFPAGVAALTLVETDSSLEELGNVISVATLAKTPEATKFPVMPEYQAVGFVGEPAPQGVHESLPLHYVTCDGVLPVVAQRLNDMLSQLTASQKSRVRAAAVLSSTDSATDNGLVL